MPESCRQALDPSRTLIVTGTWILLLLLIVAASPADGQTQHVFHIKVESDSGTWSQTGFRLRGRSGIVTALHGVAGAKSIRARSSDGPILTADLTLREVDFERDLAIISSPELDALPSEGFETVAEPHRPPEKVLVIGYPEGLSLADITTSVLVHPISPLKPLRELVPPDLAVAFGERMSPSPNLSVLSLQSGIHPGHSGAPVCNEQLQVLAVANGGLKGGTVNLNWAICLPAKDQKWGWEPARDNARLKELAASNFKHFFRAVDNPGDLEMVVEKLRAELDISRRHTDDTVRQLEAELNVKDRILSEQSQHLGLLSSQIRQMERDGIEVSPRARELAAKIPDSILDPFARALKAMAQGRFDAARQMINEIERQKELDLLKTYDLRGTNELYAGNYIASLEAFAKKENFMRGLDQGSKIREELGSTFFIMGVIADLAGKKDDATGYFEKAEAIQEILSNGEPGSTDFAKALASSSNSRGVLFLSARKFLEAEEAFKKADQIFTKLRRENPSDVELMEFGANVLDNLAQVKAETGEVGRALNFSEQAQQLRELAVKHRPDDLSLKLDQAVSLSNGAVYESGADRPQAAIELWRKALKVQGDIIALDPKEYRARVDRAGTLINLCQELFDAGDAPAALQSLETAANDLQAAASGLPESFRIARDLPRVYLLWGVFGIQIGNYELASDKLEEAARAYTQVLDSFRNNPLAIRIQMETERARALEMLAETELQAGHFAKAIQSFESVVDIRLEIARMSGDEPSEMRSIGQTRYNLGHAQYLASLQDEAAAKELLKSSLENLKEADGDFAEDNSGDSNILLLAECRSVTGLVLCLLDRNEEAELSFQNAIALADEVVRAEPNQAAARSLLGGILHNYSSMVRDRRDFEKCEELLLKAVEYQKQAVKAAPDIAQYRRYLGNHYRDLGKVHLNTQEYEEAIQWFKACTTLSPDDPVGKYTAAQYIGLAIASWKKGTKDEAKVKESENVVISLLTDAFDKGLPVEVEIEMDEAFEVMRDNPAFQALVEKVIQRRKK